MKATCVIVAMSVLVGVGGCGKKAETAGEEIRQLPPVNVLDLRMHAGNVLQESLRYEHPIIRMNAVEVVADTKQKQLMPRVQKMASQDMEMPVRFAAVMAIGDGKYYPAMQTVSRLLSDDNLNVAVAAVYALGRLGQKGHSDIIAKGLKSTNPTIKANTVLVMGKMGDKAAIRPINSVLNTPGESEKVKFQAVESLARLGDEKIFPKIWSMLISTYADDRVLGIRAMGALNTMPARNALVTLLEDQIVEVRLAAAEQLAAMGENTGEPVVLDFLQGKGVTSEEKASVRAQFLAALAIGKIGTEGLIRYLPDLLNSESRIVRLAAAKSVLILSEKQQPIGL